MSDIQSFSDIEKLWPTRAAFARAIKIGEQQEVVRKWSERGKIPSCYWVRIVSASHAIGKPVSYQRLAELADIDRA
ncbi:MAG: hypothetical protein KJO69_02415 [Gammaproteobacteria bacterium]|nr:hypothetical protein [Gammaproteobacteria bacterium]